MRTGDIKTFHEDATWQNRVEGQTGLLGTIVTRKPRFRPVAPRRSGAMSSAS
jgi:hypothetical protein